MQRRVVDEMVMSLIFGFDCRVSVQASYHSTVLFIIVHSVLIRIVHRVTTSTAAIAVVIEVRMWSISGIIRIIIGVSMIAAILKLISLISIRPTPMTSVSVFTTSILWSASRLGSMSFSSLVSISIPATAVSVPFTATIPVSITPIHRPWPRSSRSIRTSAPCGGGRDWIRCTNVTSTEIN